ncbi:MAG: protein kinase [Planctomycetia bacterium]|nr:protein kinase [Planctomycetia bacterium]
MANADEKPESPPGRQTAVPPNAPTTVPKSTVLPPAPPVPLAVPAAPPAIAAASVASGPVAGPAERYRILRPHARGALGKVSVAMDVELNREVALKEMQSRFAQDDVCRSRFVQEAEITGSLEHPNIVPIYGLGTYPDGRPYYAMRFIRGTSLQDGIAQLHAESPDAKSKRDFSGRNLEFRKLLMRFVDVCEAIQYAHDRGILHRDLKPGNIMLGKYGETLVVDWGIAKRVHEKPGAGDFGGTLRIPMQAESNETLPGTLIGTPQYMSPEQAAGEIGQLGPHSDIYSLGATLFHLVTGGVPIQADSLPAVLERVRTGDFPSARERNPRVPRALDAICHKAMAVAPADRYASATALAKDVEAWLADEPVAADPDSPFEKLARVARRNRGALGATVAGALLVAIVSLAAVFLVNEQRRKNASLAHEKGELADTNKALFLTAKDEKERAEKLADEKSALAEKNGALAEENGRQARVNAELAEVNGRQARDNAKLAAEKTALAESKEKLADENAALAAEARQQLRIATAERLAAQSRLARHEFPQRSALLAVEAANATLNAQEPIVALAREELYESLQSLGGRPIAQAAGPVTEFTADFRRLASAARNGEVQVWDLQAVDPAKARVVLRGHRAVVTELAFAPDGKRLATGDQAGEIRIWNLATPGAAQPAGVLAQPGKRVVKLAFVADGDRLVSADEDIATREGDDAATRNASRLVRIWNLSPAGAKGPASALKHPDDVRIDQIAVSIDGRRLATSDSKGIVRLWDLTAADPAVQPVALIGHEKPITKLAFSNDSKRLAAGDEKGEVRLWNLLSPDVRNSASLVRGRERDGRVQQLVFSGDARRLAIQSGGQVRVVLLTASDLDAGSVVLRGQKAPINVCRFTADNRWLATGGTLSGEVRLWDLNSEGISSNTLLSARPGADINQLAASPDSKRLAAVDSKGQAMIWDLSQPGAPPVVLRGHDAHIQHLAFLSDNRRVLTRGVDEQVRQWDLSAPDLIDGAVLLHGRSAPVGLVYSGDARRLATGDASGQVRVWDLTAPDVARSMLVFTGHKDRVQQLAWSSDGSRLATADARGEIRLWSLAPGGSTVNSAGGTLLLASHRAPIRELAFGPDGKWLAMRDVVSELRLWNLAADDIAKSETPLEGHKAVVQQIVFSPDGHELITADELGEVRIWRLGAAGTPQCDVPVRGLRAKLRRVAFNSNGRHFLAAGDNGEARIWDFRAPDADQSGTLLEGHRGHVLEIAFTPDGKRMLSADEQGGIRLWDLTAPPIARRAILLGGHKAKIDQLTISGGGRRLLTGDANGEVRLWDLAAEKVDASGALLHGYDSYLDKIAFSSDGQWLAARDARGVLRLWNLSTADTTRSPVVLHGHEGAVMSFVFSPDGQWLTTGDERGNIRLWDLDVGRLIDRLRRSVGRDLSDSERLTYQVPKPAPSK